MFFDIFLKILNLAISPWTVFWLVIVIVFRSEFKSLLNCIIDYLQSASSLTIKFKDFEINSECKDRILNKLNSLDEKEASDISESTISVDSFTKQKEQLIDNLKAEELSAFLSIYANNDMVVLHDYQHQKLFIQLAILGLIEMKDTFPVFFRKRGTHVIWEITSIGKIIRETHHSIISQNKTNAEQGTAPNACQQ